MILSPRLAHYTTRDCQIGNAARCFIDITQIYCFNGIGPPVRAPVRRCVRSVLHVRS